ncbi:MAG TPA: MFS transporter [Chloroflexi bacterium]|nr:MFS transporter [Chloroflexota bacterium]
MNRGVLADSGHQQIIQLLDNAPLRRQHIWVWALASGGTLVDGFSVFMLGIALPLLSNALSLTAVQSGLLGAALVAGAAFGAALGGRLGDRLGRKMVFLLDMALLMPAALISALIENALGLLIAQAVVGVAIGMDFPVSGSYIAECMPHRQRSRMMVATIASQSAGMLLAAALSLVLLEVVTYATVWRWFFGAEAVVAAIFLLARLSLPESPRWLMGQGRNQDAVHMLQRLIPTDSQELTDIAARLGQTAHFSARVPQPAGSLSVMTLFHPAYRRRTLLSALPWFLMDFATYGVGLFTAVLLAAMHFDATATSPVAHTMALVRGSGAIDFFLLLGFLLGMWAVHRYGRIRMQLVGFAGMAAGMGILLLSALLAGGASEHVVLVVLGFTIFNLFMNMGPNSTTYILPAELFPTQLRATAAGFAAASAKVGATLGVLTLPLIKTDFGVPAVLMLVLLVSILGLVSTWFFRVEGHGLTLEEHQSAAIA